MGAEELFLVIRHHGIATKAQKFANSPADRQRLVNKLLKHPGITVCLEATGAYSLDLARALADAGIRLRVLNPKASHNFAKVLLRNSKTDGVDADTLAQYAERMPFQPWKRPSDEALTLRALARRISTLTQDKAAAKNQLHALTATASTPQAVLRDALLSIAQLEKRIDHLATQAKAFILEHPLLANPFALLLTVKGIGEASAIALLGELLLLPDGLTTQTMGQVRRAGSTPC